MLIDRGDRDQDRPEQQRVLRPSLGAGEAGVGRAAENLELGRDLGQHDLPVDRHGGDRHDRPDDVDPPRHPRRVAGRDLLGPLIDRTGDRILRRHLHEAQGDQDLANDDHRPRPPHARTGVEIAEPEQRRDAGQDRDVAEAGREGREAAQRAVELLLVAEACELIDCRPFQRSASPQWLPSINLPGRGTRLVEHHGRDTRRGACNPLALLVDPGLIGLLYISCLTVSTRSGPSV